jgi:solute carrier family 38 (sodium-coupled neutral amino acid transporter), member 11
MLVEERDSHFSSFNPLGRRPTVNALHLGVELELSTTSTKSDARVLGMDSDAEERETDYAEVAEDGSVVKLANNSAALTIFLLLNTMIGSGILNQPFVFANAGVLGGLLSFILATWATWTSLNIITHVGIHTHILEYSGLAKKAFNKVGIMLVDVFIVINAFGALLGYILIIGETMSGLLKGWGCEKSVCEVDGITLLLVIFLVLPLCLFRQFGHLAIVSVFSITTITLVLGLVTIGAPIRTRNDNIGESVKVLDVMGSFQSIGSIIFALSCLPANLQAFVAGKKEIRTLDSWKKVTLYTVSIGATMCCSMGIAGYLSFRDGTEGDILNNFKSKSFDFFKFMVVMHLVAYIPVDFIVMRYSIVKIVLDKKAETLSMPLHVTLTIVLLTICTAAILLMLAAGFTAGEAFTLTLDLTGGVGGSFTGFIMPAAIYLKLMPEDSEYYFMAKILMGLGFVFMILVTTATFVSLKDGK